jgi:hypothetical protein
MKSPVELLTARLIEIQTEYFRVEAMPNQYVEYSAGSIANAELLRVSELKELKSLIDQYAMAIFVLTKSV